MRSFALLQGPSAYPYTPHHDLLITPKPSPAYRYTHSAGIGGKGGVNAGGVGQGLARSPTRMVIRHDECHARATVQEGLGPVQAGGSGMIQSGQLRRPGWATPGRGQAGRPSDNQGSPGKVSRRREQNSGCSRRFFYSQSKRGRSMKAWRRLRDQASCMRRQKGSSSSKRSRGSRRWLSA